MKEADDQISKRGHVAGSIPGSDPRGVLLEGYISDIMQPVFNAPVVAVQGKELRGIGLIGIKGSQTVGDFFGGLVLF